MIVRITNSEGSDQTALGSVHYLPYLFCWVTSIMKYQDIYYKNSVIDSLFDHFNALPALSISLKHKI